MLPAVQHEYVADLHKIVYKHKSTINGIMNPVCLPVLYFLACLDAIGDMVYINETLETHETVLSLE